MAHELSIRANGFVEHAYAGEVGWHGMGNAMQPGQSREEWLKAAGMDWKALRGIVRYAVDRTGDESAFMEMPDRHVLFRSDTKAPLGVVSDKYKIVQPAAVIDFFFTEAAKQGCELETAGVLFDGRKIWGMAKVGADAVIADPADKLKGYLLLATSLDGSMATEARFTSVRVVCNNTLEFARGAAAKVKTSHRTKFNAAQTQRDMGIGEQFSDFITDMRRLCDVAMTEAKTVLATAELFSPGATEIAKSDAAAFEKILNNHKVRTVLDLSLNGNAKGGRLDGVKGTAWGWLNAVTEYFDHHAFTRGGDAADNRVNSALFGTAAATKVQAREVAMEMVGASGNVHTVYKPMASLQAPVADDAGLLDAILAG